MEADQGRCLAGIEVADDGVADLPVKFLKGVGLGVDRGTGCAGSVGAVLRFLDHEKDFLHGPLQWHQCGSGGRDAAPVWAKGLGRDNHTRSRGLQAQNARTRRDNSRGFRLTGRPETNLAQALGSRHHPPMPPHPCPTYEHLRQNIAQRMRMSHIYQPLMLMELLGHGFARQQPAQPRRRTSPGGSWGMT